jgi:hypothetical protein
MTDAEADDALSLALEFEPKASLDDMILAVMDRRWTVYNMQKVRLVADLLKRPIDECVRECAVLMALEDFLLKIKQRPADVARSLQKRGANVEA